MRTIVLAIAPLLVVAGCSVPTGEEAPAPAERVGSVEQPQIDLGAHTLLQGGVIVASAWKGSTSFGTREYWVKKAAYAPGGARTIRTTSQSCSAWKASVCGSGWSGSTYQMANWTQSALSCSSPPGTITPPGGAVSFLGNGGWIANDGAANFGWTYVTGNVEYRAMNHLVGATGATVTTQTPYTGYSSFSNFVSSVCAMSPPPTTWFTASYSTMASFCSSSTC